MSARPSDFILVTLRGAIRLRVGNVAEFVVELFRRSLDSQDMMSSIEHPNSDAFTFGRLDHVTGNLETRRDARRFLERR